MSLFFTWIRSGREDAPWWNRVGSWLTKMIYRYVTEHFTLITRPHLISILRDWRLKPALRPLFIRSGKYFSLHSPALRRHWKKGRLAYVITQVTFLRQSSTPSLPLFLTFAFAESVKKRGIVTLQVGFFLPQSVRCPSFHFIPPSFFSPPTPIACVIFQLLPFEMLVPSISWLLLYVLRDWQTMNPIEFLIHCTK